MSLPWWAFAGNKVVCVDAGAGPSVRFGVGYDGWPPGEAPAEGRVYTIKRAQPDPCGEWSVELAEIVRRPMRGMWVGYAVERFRPVITDDGELELGIYLGKNLHAKPPVKERA